MSDEDDNQTSSNSLRYVTSDLAKAMYIVACLALDVFLVLQIYNWFPTLIVGILAILLLGVLSVLEVWAYKLLKRLLTQ